MGEERKTPTVQRPARRLGRVHVLLSRCTGCGLCIEFCPRRVLAFSEGVNERGYHTPVVCDGVDCTLCKTCYLICPGFAIYVTPEDEPTEAEAGLPNLDVSNDGDP